MSRKPLALTYLALACLALVFALPALAGEKERAEDPFQVTLNVYGGGSIGYHLTPALYLGVMQTNGLTMPQQEASPQRRSSGYDGNCPCQEYYGYSDGAHVAGSLGLRQAAEVRFTPWDWGFFISGGYMKGEPESETIEYEKKTRLLGNSYYNTGFTAKVKYAAFQGPFMGMGWNANTESGFAFTLAMMGGPVNRQEDPQVQVYDYDVKPDAADRQTVKDEIQWQANQRGAGMVLIGLGFAF